MVLVDTSIWISHFREGNSELKILLEKGEVVCHPFIIGELACGNLRNRRSIISLLQALPFAVIADYEEVLHFIEQRQLMGIGLGYIDTHLLASTILTGVSIWTADKKLKEAALELEIFHK